MKTTSKTRITAAAATSGMSLLLLVGCAATDDDATALSVPSQDTAAACAELAPETMAAADTAFLGTVTAIADGQVTLRVDDSYEGDIGEHVTVPQQQDGLPNEFSIGAFADGEQYLIAANEGVILTCGQSGPATPSLTALYDAAF